MQSALGFFIELIRIAVVFLLLGMLGSSLMIWIYSDSAAEPFAWLSSLGVLLLLFVLYRNKWQFTGWYKCKEGKKLSGYTTIILILISIGLIISPLLLGI